MDYWLGLDGGGTRTTVCAEDAAGTELARFEVGALNINGERAGAAEEALAEAARELGRRGLPLAGCVSLAVGAAGISNPQARERLTGALAALAFRGELTLAGDQETALAGALEGRPGIALIAGTGSIAYGRSEAGETHRAGGFGHLIDDEGSGYAIGRDMLAAIVRAADGRSRPTALAEPVFRQLGLEPGSLPELVRWVYDPARPKSSVAALAPLLQPACEAGDAAALGIARRAAGALAELAEAVAVRLGLGRGELAPLGSVLLRCAPVRDAFAERLAERLPQLRLTAASRDAASGAVLLARRALPAAAGGGEGAPC
ncbi:N-acetylglucosamine kinase [Paenibacillus pasadenensis]|uniref:Kinase similar to eukaryotic-like N-acetylglucosamine kinase n=2 Tax=Paenibacillus pasadenensis TaxID=217090 RepID=A0A2N5N043_9BACL|nr:MULTISPECIES: BadF/BadG/BcrA/BcrD ATPase family protein [Paenibacillus]PLT43696.1 Kinase similar to eukaryotic-like N-acetylglucosamine kinase [Paenibacillus pasadenensis]QGG54322.1 ATPase [Paenibacillus sp. B01]